VGEKRDKRQKRRRNEKRHPLTVAPSGDGASRKAALAACAAEGGETTRPAAVVSTNPCGWGGAHVGVVARWGGCGGGGWGGEGWGVYRLDILACGLVIFVEEQEEEEEEVVAAAEVGETSTRMGTRRR
jgi:hypothetical protein